MFATLRKDLLYISFGLFVLSYFLAAKICLYRGFEYADDLFNSLEFARGPFVGKPFFYYNDLINENFAYSNVHAYLAQIIFFGPLAYIFGAYGLFVGTIIWLFAAWYAVVSVTSDLPNHLRKRLLIVFSLLFFGPLTWWFYDDPFHGWHPEILFFPISILFGITLHNQSKLVWVFGILLLSIQEIGPLVAMAILVTQRIMLWSGDMKSLRQNLHCNAKLLLVGLCTFTIYIIVFQSFFPKSHSRFSVALHYLLEQAFFHGDLTRSAFDIAMMSILLLLASWTFWKSKVAIRKCVLLLIGCSPLLFVHWFAGFAYMNFSSKFGLLWPSRFASVWGVVLVSILINILNSFRSNESGLRIISGRVKAYFPAITVFFTFFVLTTLFSQSNMLERFVRIITRRQSEYVEALSSSDMRLLKSIAKALPRDRAIGIDRRLTIFFDLHDTISTCPLLDYKPLPSVFICAKDPRFAPNCVEACQLEVKRLNPYVQWNCESDNILISGNRLEEMPENLLSWCRVSKQTNGS